MRRLRLLLMGLAWSPLVLFAQNEQTPIQRFVEGLRGEFNASVPFLVGIVGVVFVFAWLIRFVMAKVKQASR